MYQPRLDGIRGLSILAVLAYHFEVPGFSGGYIGVDVFFVLSGYLITSLILQELRAGTFSVFQFWGKRIRRLLPAYLAMALACLIAGFFLLAVSDFSRLAMSLLWQSLSASNLYLKKYVGYFDPPSDLNPFTHTWSLAVEEQFYLVFPLVLFGLRNRSKAIPITMGVVCLASFACCAFVQSTAPVEAFFLTPHRAWEILAGGGLAFIQWLPTPHSTLATLSLGMVSLPPFTFNASTAHPSWITLLPTLGTCGLIAFATPTTPAGRILSHPRLVQLGQLSYSLYLWHWPLLAFYRYRWGYQFSLQTLWLLPLVLICSTLSYRYLERPARTLWPARNVVLGSVLASTIISALACGVLWKEGFPERFSHSSLRFERASLDRENWKLQGEARLKKLIPTQRQKTTRVLFWGNSHRGHLHPVVRILAAKYGVDIEYPTQNCPWFILEPPSHPCAKATRLALERLNNGQYTHLLWAAGWERLSTERDFETKLQTTGKLIQQTGVNTTVVLPIPIYTIPIPARLSMATHWNEDLNSLHGNWSQFKRQIAAVEKTLASTLPPSFHQIDPAPALCPNQNICLTHKDGQSLYSDTNHLTIAGALELLPALEPYFKRISQVQ